MKNYLRLALSVMTLMFLFSALAVSESKAQNILPEILKRMDEHQKALTSLKASVTMDKYNAQLDEHDIYEGNVNYLPAKGRDALIRLDWTSPQQETLSVVNMKRKDRHDDDDDGLRERRQSSGPGTSGPSGTLPANKLFETGKPPKSVVK